MALLKICRCGKTIPYNVKRCEECQAKYEQKNKKVFLVIYSKKCYNILIPTKLIQGVDMRVDYNAIVPIFVTDFWKFTF